VKVALFSLVTVLAPVEPSASGVVDESFLSLTVWFSTARGFTVTV
jgi:hypothetical protein